MSDHTQGPWAVSTPSFGGPLISVVEPGGGSRFIATVMTRWIRYGQAGIEADEREAEAFANARLIAAAPDLLAATIAAHLMLCGCPMSGSGNLCSTPTLRDAIRKATEPHP